MKKKRCGLCCEFKKMAGVVPLPATGDLIVCGECLEMFKAEFREMERQGRGIYIDLVIERPKWM